jgi:hypothetical protein
MSTDAATSSNAASTASNNGAASPPATPQPDSYLATITLASTLTWLNA